MRDLLRQQHAAVAADDPSAYCHLLSRKARNPPDLTDRQCAKLLVSTGSWEARKEALAPKPRAEKLIDGSEIEIKGDVAEVRIPGGGVGHAVREDGVWKLGQ